MKHDREYTVEQEIALATETMRGAISFLQQGLKTLAIVSGGALVYTSGLFGNMLKDGCYVSHAGFLYWFMASIGAAICGRFFFILLMRIAR